MSRALALFVLCCSLIAGDATDVHVPVLLYHRLGPRPGSTTVTTSVFREQMKLIRDRGYHVIRLRELIDYLVGKGPPPSPKSVVLTADDGHGSIYSDMYPIVKEYTFPVTLFIYPSAISRARWAMTWDELRTLQDSGLFDIQSHTYWHPNFQHEKEGKSPADYSKFVDWQFRRSKDVLTDKLQKPVDLLAWPFGIYDQWLMTEAAKDGYIAAFTIVPHPVNRRDNMMALPRFVVTDSDRGERFVKLLSE